MVNDVLESCYGSFDYDLGHTAVTPLQWFSDTTKCTFGKDSENLVYVKFGE